MAGAHIPSVRFNAWMYAWAGPTWCIATRRNLNVTVESYIGWNWKKRDTDNGQLWYRSCQSANQVLVYIILVLETVLEYCSTRVVRMVLCYWVVRYKGGTGTVSFNLQYLVLVVQWCWRVILGNTPETPEYADSGVNRGLIPGCNLGC